MNVKLADENESLRALVEKYKSEYKSDDDLRQQLKIQSDEFDRYEKESCENYKTLDEKYKKKCKELEDKENELKSISFN
jgi:hypothetical protein